MNKWTKKSIRIANKPGYLDTLSAIYVMNVNVERPLTPELEKQIRTAYRKKDTPALIHLLLDNSVFPVKDSYVGFLRIKRAAIDENPNTIRRIGERLYTMGVDALVREASRPKETNRQLGHSFKSWMRQIGYPVLPESEFDKHKGIAVLMGSDAALAKYARGKLGSTLKKGIDLLLKKNGRYLIGEAKFLTTPGGEQNGGFEDASSFIHGAHEKKTKRIALLDGYVWLESKSGIYSKIIKNDLDIFSALLLPEYIDQF